MPKQRARRIHPAGLCLGVRGLVSVPHAAAMPALASICCSGVYDGGQVDLRNTLSRPVVTMS